MRIAIASSSIVSKPLVDRILQSKYQFVGFLTLPARRVGRGRQYQENAITEYVLGKQVEIFKPENFEEIADCLELMRPDLVITASYGKLIPKYLLDRPKYGWLNIHFSLLPRWRGAAPAQWAILSGDGKSGISIFKLDEGMDTGPLYLQVEYPLNESVTTEILLHDLAELSATHILSVVEMIEAGQAPTPQVATGSTRAPKIAKDYGLIDWNTPSQSILRKIRALGVRPGVFTFVNGRKINIHQASELREFERERTPGEIFFIENDLAIRTQDSALAITQVTPAGAKRMSGADFARGARLVGGERCFLDGR